MYSDLPVIVSEDYCGFLEPQEHIWKGESGKGYYLEDLLAMRPQALIPYYDICGCSKNEPFCGRTLFRFPLRNKPSKLSEELYTISKLLVLLESLKAEAKYILLFLRSVCSIEVIEISVPNTLKSVFKVSIDTDTYIQHITQQQQLLSDVQSTFIIDSLSTVRNVIKSSDHFNIEVHDDSSHSEHEWIVVNQVGSEDTEVMQLAEKQHVLPWVGTAFEVSTTPCYGGRIFCVLPLPIEDRAPFSVHINGSFAVSSNRRSLKWEAQERKDDEESTWNKLLVNKCLPSCYARLVSELIQLCPSNYTAIYSCWPDIDQIKGTPWEGILKLLYKRLLYSSQVVYTPIFGGQWISISESIFVNEDAIILQPVKECVLRCQVKLVEVDYKQRNALHHYYAKYITILNPSMVRMELKKNSRVYESMPSLDKLAILDYCLSDHKYNDFSGLKLLPLLNGDFVQFTQTSHSLYGSTTSYICSSSTPHTILPGLEHILVSIYSDNPTTHSNLIELAKSGQTQLKVLGVPEVAMLLPQSNPESWSDKQLAFFWQWLQNKALHLFHKKQIVPIKHLSGLTTVMPLAIQGGVVYVPPYFPVSSTLLAALEKCSIKLANARDFNYLDHKHLTQYLYQFNPDDILDAMQGFSLGNIKLSSKEAEALQTFLSSSTLSTVARVNTVCTLPIFSVIQDTGNRHSINSIKTPYYGNTAIAESTPFDLKIDLLSTTPLVISRHGNDKNILLNLSKHVSLINEIQFLLHIAFNQIQNREFNISNMVPFMTSILDSFDSMRRKYPSLFKQFKKAISTLPFIPVSSSTVLQAPCNLFDPQDAMLKELFREQSVFPGPEFSSYLYVLRQCGLKSINSITGTDILQIITSVQVYSETGLAISNEINIARVVAVLCYLNKYPQALKEKLPIRQNNLQNALVLQGQRFCWLPIASDPPKNYPACLQWKGSSFHHNLISTRHSPLVILSQSICSSQLPMIAGSQAIFVENVPSQIAQCLCSCSKGIVAAVVAHFKEIFENKEKIESDVLEQLSYQTYSYLQDNVAYCDEETFNDIENWVWMESKSTFISSSMVAIRSNPTFRQSLEPFVFTLSNRLQKFNKLLFKCGIHPQITTNHILSVLHSIKDRPGHISTEEAWSLVKAILDWVVDDPSRMNDGELLVPVQSDSPYPQLQPVEKVTYTDNKMLLNIAMTSDEEYMLVHDKVAHLAPQLGLNPLSDHLDITEDVFEDAGQHEPLITRLSNILKEYKDGLTIIKEMIQNADDAEATEVNILYDARQHTTEKLLLEGMADCHGPALVVHNNSTFTDEDFENITKLAGATKADEALKIGKFGVGFCSVYHITDVPSFVSGEWLYIFDPTLQYLKGIVRNENRPGKKMKYLSKFVSQSQQLVPYEGLFGFKSSTVYHGTMFRFPFRKSSSQISSTLYNEHMISQLRKDLSDNGSKLLLFLQHVKRITFSSINSYSSEPKLEVSIEISSLSNQREIKCVANNQKDMVEYWLVLNHKQELQTQDYQMQSSKASIACQLIKGDEPDTFSCELIEGCVFCFLPLEVPNTGLPVHVSANFAVMSNRHGIWTGSSRIASDSSEWWNQKLMESTIPKAYCSLLNTLQVMCTSGQLLNYVFYSLWPLNTSLQSKHPWEILSSALYKMISESTLFHSVSVNKWLTLTESKFISPDIFNVPGVDILSSINKAVCILELPVVSLPCSYLDQLKREGLLSRQFINQNEFVETFFTHLYCFDSNIGDRNEVLSIILRTVAITKEEALLVKYLKEHPCIPCSPYGVQVKLATELVDPHVFENLFNPDDEMFPLSDFYENSLICQAMKLLGLLSSKSNLPWNIIVYCARTVDNLFIQEKTKALKRIKLILSSIKDKATQLKTNSLPEELDELKNISFLPILSKPEAYFLPWKGEGHHLLSPSQVISMNMSKAGLIVGSQKAIVNTNYVYHGGCGNIPPNVLTLLGVQTRPSVNDVLLHFQCLIDDIESETSTKPDKPKVSTNCDKSEISTKLDMISQSCRHVYEFLDDEIYCQRQAIDTKHQTTQVEEIVEIFQNKAFVWTGNCFAVPTDVAKNWKMKDGPYLYKLPDMISDRKHLIKALNIKNDFSVLKLLQTFQCMYHIYKAEQLPSEYHELVDCMISELNSSNLDEVDLGTEPVILVDDTFVLRPAKQLSFNDASWLPAVGDCNYVHAKLTSRQTALALGVEPTSNKFLETFTFNAIQHFAGIKFGQREDLTQRIKNILQDYPLDVTFLKELLQNADDAKATKMYIILDKRTHGKDQILSPEWAELQGPALLVWNDKDFTDKDLEGIQKLGLGSKQVNTESIGQFGIGFNVVYHVTDCPSFITRGNILCVFDPHCRYVPGSDKDCPGRQYNVDDNFWKNMSDLQSAYVLPEQLSCFNKDSLFRFPLRSTIEQIEASEIVDMKNLTKPLTAEVMERNVVNWVCQIKDALLFLNHLTRLDFYVIDGESCECKTSYRVHLDNSALQTRSSLHNIFGNFKDLKQPQVVTYPLTIKTETSEEKWLIQQGVGDLQNHSQNWSYIDRTLPRHGIAAPMQHHEHFNGKLFCFLPLPVQTGLPVHINGQFALSRNRRSLWNSDSSDDSRTNWNSFLIEAIASSYVHFLTQARDYYVHPEGYQSLDDLYAAFNCYYNLLPFYLGKPAEKTKLVTSYRSQDTELDQRIVFSQNIVAGKTVQIKFGCSVFKKLWSTNVPALASEVFPSSPETFYFVKWHLLHNDDNPIKQAYFKTKMDKELEKILRNIGMILTCAPYDLYNHLKEFNPAKASIESIYNYYTTFYADIVDSYPCPIEQTPFNSIASFCFFLKHLLTVYVEGSVAQKVFPHCPFGYPLLLTADGNLRLFEEHERVICSKFSHLFTNTASLFLHPKVLENFPNLCSSYFLYSEDIDLNLIHEIMKLNYGFLHNSKVVNYNTVLNDDTLKELWVCLTEDKIFQHYQAELLNSWALVPSSNETLYNTCSPILPLVTPSNVTDFHIENAFKILVSLGIPVLNSEISKEPEKYCLQMTSYNQVLAVLFNMHIKKHILNNLNDPKTTIQVLFQYFSKIDFRHDKDSVTHITSMPLFETINGHLTSIYGKEVFLFPNGFCKAGYKTWAPIDRTIFLDPRGPWKTLCSNISSLGGQELDKKDIYANIIFPIFSQLLSKEREEHLRYIKNEMHQDVIYESEKKRSNTGIRFLNKLKELNCLELKNGETLCPIANFVDHTLSIFKTFPNYFSFVPEEYKKREWLKFLRDLGLRVTITCTEFKRFCEFISQGQHSDFVEASKVLVRYLFSKSAQEWHNNDSYLAEIGNIGFVQVDPLNNLRWIKAACQPSCYFPQQNVGLTKLNEAVIYDSAPLVWTVKPVVSLPNMDYLKQQEYDNFVKKLGVTTSPEVYDVYTNILNVSKTGLANFKLFNKYDPKYICDIKDQDKVTITDVIVKSLQYLFMRKANNIQNLQTIPCIPVHANSSNTEHYIKQPVLVKPIQVVRYLSPEDKNLFPYLHSLPTCLNIVNEELDIIGVCQNISIANIQHLLETMYLQFNDCALDPNSEASVQKAIMKLYELLKVILIPQVVKPLYLPALLASRSNQYSLKDSTSLVFIDSDRYKGQDLTFINTPYSLFQLPSDTKPSVVSMQSTVTLSTIANNKDICLQLPKDVRPKGLSLHCNEKILIHSECQDNSPLFVHFQKLKDLVPSLSEVLPKILSAHYKSTTMTFDDTIINKFTLTLTELIKSVPVVVIRDLRSKILLKSEYDIGTMKVQFLLQNDDDNYTLFVDIKGTPSYSLRRQLANTLCIEVARIHNVDLTTYLKAVKPVCEFLEIQCPSDLMPILEKYNVEAQDVENTTVTNDNTVSLGKKIPNDITFSLDRDIYYIFHPEEWVGYEITEGYFIYAIVLYPLPDETDNPLAKKYKIIVDESEQGVREVSTLDLYKLIPNIPEKQSESSELVLADQGNATAQVRQVTDSQKLLEIKRTICKELKSIWELKDEVEKRKALRRLYFKYHPDKADPNEHDLYEDVFKFLKRQIDRLEEGLPLEDPDLAQESPHSTPRPSHWTHCYNGWDDYVRTTSSTWRSRNSRTRERNEHNQTRAEDDTTKIDSRWEMIFNLQPKRNLEEAKRWLRQAESDLKVIRCLMHSSLHCQVLFQAHEASEKALKAGMYALVGLNPSSLKTHDLVCHAYAISSEKGGDWTRLPNLVSSMEQYYLNSRFPNKHTLPNAPVDIYTQAQAKEMADNAEEVVKLIRRCVQ